MRRKIGIITCISLLCLLLSGGEAGSFPVKISPVRAQADVSTKVLKMCKGKWNHSWQDGINTYHCIFTKKYQKWYRNGKFDYKVKIVKVVKKSSKKYIFKMKTNDGKKYHYEAVVKKKKIIGFDFFSGWKGREGYSGSSSLYKLE